MSAPIAALVAGLRARTWHGGATLRLHEESCEAILALLRRDWAVRVLDAWASRGTIGNPRRWSSDTERALLGEYIRGRWQWQWDLYEPTPTASRLAAAEAVWTELPESVRAELGERP